MPRSVNSVASRAKRKKILKWSKPGWTTKKIPTIPDSKDINKKKFSFSFRKNSENIPEK